MILGFCKTNIKDLGTIKEFFGIFSSEHKARLGYQKYLTSYITQPDDTMFLSHVDCEPMDTYYIVVPVTEYSEYPILGIFDNRKDASKVRYGCVLKCKLDEVFV